MDCSDWTPETCLDEVPQFSVHLRRNNFPTPTRTGLSGITLLILPLFPGVKEEFGIYPISKSSVRSKLGPDEDVAGDASCGAEVGGLLIFQVEAQGLSNARIQDKGQGNGKPDRSQLTNYRKGSR